MPAASLDPFDAAKDEVVQKLHELDALWELYQEQKQGGHDDEYTVGELIQELSKNCRTVEFYLKDLERTVQIVEKQPKQFGITTKELQNRRQFISQTKNNVENIKREISSRKNRRVKEDRKALLSGSDYEPPAQSAYQKQVIKNNQDFIDSQLQLQQTVRQQQDTNIDRAIEATERIHGIVVDIGDELDQQNHELNEFEGEVEQTANLLRRTSHRLEKLMSVGGDVGKIVCIIALVIIIGVILVLLFTF